MIEGQVSNSVSWGSLSELTKASYATHLMQGLNSCNTYLPLSIKGVRFILPLQIFIYFLTRQENFNCPLYGKILKSLFFLINSTIISHNCLYLDSPLLLLFVDVTFNICMCKEQSYASNKFSLYKKRKKSYHVDYEDL